MKNFKIFIAALTLTLGGLHTMSAQAVASKVCHVESQKLVELMPEAIAAEKQLNDLNTTYSAKISQMDREVKAKLQNAANTANTKTKEENERIKEAIMQDQQKLEEYYQNSQRNIATKRNDLLKPIYEKVRTTIFKIAREKGFDYVLDSTTGTGVIMADGYDLTPDVMKGLGIKESK
ncbi:MAG: OmpH family outer membrane protein [Nonlabens sp.]